MKEKFLIIGGDLRNVKLATILANNYNNVSTYALEKSEEILENKHIISENNLSNAINKADIIIGPIPFSSNGKNLNTPFSEEKIEIEEISNKNKKKIFIAGSINDDITKKLEDNYMKVIDVMKREELAILNTIATAEGTITVAIENTDKILQGSKVLVLGFGRVAKIVATKFSKLSADVTCCARKISDLAWIKAYGYNSLNINDMIYDLKDFDIIINTVPQMIINEKELKHMKSSVLLIDLASRPGGIDGKKAINMGLKYVWALALPGKIAPISSAEFIKETIYNIVDEMSKNDD